MPDGSPQSDALAVEIWTQALAAAATLCEYFMENGIELAVPVNINSNPGNLASAMAMVLTSELTGVRVLNSNHDFYWEGGKSPSERAAGEDPGVRDHFFRNWGNRPFFLLFQRLLPWDGRRWIQVNINRPQSDTLVEKYGFLRERVFEIGTSVDDDFFVPYTREEKYARRARMAYVLSDGNRTIQPVAVDDHLSDLGRWMGNQKPLVCGSRTGLRLDISSPHAIYLLQPTRIIARKRIEEDWRLIEALFKYTPFRQEFDRVPDRTFTLHITGPVPIEHQMDLEKVLHAYRRFVGSLPADLGDRIFQAFSVGTEDHPALHENQLEKLFIQDIFKMADLVLFPSETEGRGLPIMESSATGIPIVAARYYPEEVFSGVVGEHLEERLQVRYIPFPMGDFGDEILQAITDCIFFPDRAAARIEHNRNAVADRYSTSALHKHFADYLKALVQK
ncbi:MAG: glycosyltransferase family 4 protein [Gammaproteobacteria bacterium]|nr:glycosyltransferase family 4 protein [Gammaproteobacteria bacterium]